MRNTRQPFQKGFLQRRADGEPHDHDQGPLPRRALALAPQRRAPMFIGDTKDGYPKPDGKYTFDKLSSVYITGNATRDDAPEPHPRAEAACRARSPRRGSGCARPPSTRSPRTRPRTGDVDVIVNYTNCVQCGAITAKGGRLTTPEGGDGPLYQNT